MKIFVAIVLVILGLYIFDIMQSKYILKQREKYCEESGQLSNEYNKTGKPEILEIFYKNLYSSDGYIQRTSIQELSKIKKERQTIEIERKLLEFKGRLNLNNDFESSLNHEIIKTLSKLNLKTKDAIDIVLSNLDDWNTILAECVASEFIVNREEVFEEFITKNYLKNLKIYQEETKELTVYKALMEDERYKKILTQIIEKENKNKLKQ